MQFIFDIVENKLHYHLIADSKRETSIPTPKTTNANFPKIII